MLKTFTHSALAAPVYLGADIVIHSSTKYLGCHTDVFVVLNFC
ncbi:PLP-dependent transferase [Bacillus sp. ISL-7]|nr:PLP-dependent transferase [Bacillus sp. ISL-7]